MDVMSLADRVWPVLRLAMGAHVRIYRVSNGLIGHRFPGAPPMLLLDHVGAKTGTKRTTPLVYVEDDRDVVIVASKGGHPRNPASYHNLRANPDTTVQIGADRRAVHARVATREERERLWPKAVATYAGYRDYQQRTDRTIPLVLAIALRRARAAWWSDGEFRVRRASGVARGSPAPAGGRC